MTDETVYPVEPIIEVETSAPSRANVSAFYSEPGPIADQPSILDYRSYGDFDPAGEGNSVAAFSAIAADVNDNGLVGLITPGRWSVDSPEPIRLAPGAGLIGVQAGFPGRPENGQRQGAMFLRKYSANRMAPLFAMGGGSRLEGLTIYYPDHIARLLAGEYELNGSQYGNELGNPFFAGAPEAYGPTIIADFGHDQFGNPAPVKSGGLRIRDINVIGAWDFLYCGDARSDEEPDLAEYGSGNGYGSGNFMVERIRGMVLNRGITLERMTVLSTFRDIYFSGAFWTEASQLGHDTADFQPHIRWAQEHAYAVFVRHRAVGLRVVDSTFRNMRAVLKVSAGVGNGPGGVDRGKLNSSSFLNIGVENITTFAEVDADAFLTGNKFVGGGLWHIKDYPSCTRAVFEIMTDGAVAGTTNHEDEWIRMDTRNYYNNTVSLGTSATAGPLLRTTAADAHADYIFDGGRQAGVCLGDKTLAAFQVRGDPSLLIHRNAMFVAWNHSTSTVYEVTTTNDLGVTSPANDVETGKLQVQNVTFKGLTAAEAVKDTPAWDGYSGCNFIPGVFDPDDLDDGTDPDGGDAGDSTTDNGQ